MQTTTRPLTRRQMISSTILGAAASLTVPRSLNRLAAAQVEDAVLEQDSPFRYCLNTGTIRGFNLTIDQQIDVAASAGYSGLEPWVNDIRKHVEQGGTLEDLRKRAEEAGIAIESAITFPAWISDDPDARVDALDRMRADMELVVGIGGTRIAAPPSGGTRERMTDLDAIAERYRAVLELGDETGVTPMLELWGFSQTLSRLGEVAYVVTQAAHPKASLLLDAYHMYKGGNSFEGLAQLSGSAMSVFHINDYPADPPREQIGDADRVFPGDGVCPLDFILKTLYATGFRGVLSLELFNRDYWADFENAEACAAEGLRKTKAVVEAAMSSVVRHAEGIASS